MALLTIQPSESTPPKRRDDMSNARHRQLIGYIGLALPWLLIVVVLWRDGLTVWQGLDSVSAYYYTGANPLFVGMLFVLGLFLAAYQGYANKLQKWDRLFARIAAAAAILVAFFPTAAPPVDGITPLAWWAPWMGCLHFWASIVLFAAFAVFCLWLFRATEKSAAASEDDKERRSEPDQDKKWRNRFYFLCGTVILAAIMWAGYNNTRGKPIFWQEATALTFFALSWLVKGKWLRSLAQLPGVKKLVRPAPPPRADEGSASEEEDAATGKGRQQASGRSTDNQ